MTAPAVGRMAVDGNPEQVFLVMAGMGFDALIMAGAQAPLKARVGSACLTMVSVSAVTVTVRVPDGGVGEGDGDGEGEGDGAGATAARSAPARNARAP